MGRMVAVGRSLVDQGGAFKSELSPEKAGVAGFEAACGARAERGVEMKSALWKGNESMEACDGTNREGRSSDGEAEKMRGGDDDDDETGSGGCSSREKARGQKRGDQCGESRGNSGRY